MGTLTTADVIQLFNLKIALDQFISVIFLKQAIYMLLSLRMEYLFYGLYRVSFCMPGIVNMVRVDGGWEIEI